MTIHKYEPQDIVVLYTEKHWTYQQIADHYGMSKQHVGHILKKAGITPDRGTWVNCICDYCGVDFKKTRVTWRKTARHYCTEQCYFKSRENPMYIPWRQGQKIAESVVRSYYQYLKPHHVVHHRDGDNRNNDPSNLMVFENQSDHMKYHHGVNDVSPLWPTR